MTRALVTGGAGFLGSHIADALTERGFDVTVFDRVPSPHLRNGQEMIVGDLLDTDAIEAAVKGRDCVFHLAALADLNQARDRPVETVRTNVLGTVNMLEAARSAEIERFLFASTVYVYSRDGGFYRCSKQACEGYVEEFQRQYGLPYTILRYGSLYGPRADASNGVFRLLRQAIEDGRIDYSGSPEDIREYIHVEDAAGLSIDALAKDYENKHLLLSGSAPLRAAELFTMFSEILGRPLEIRYSEGSDETNGHYSVTPYAYTPKPGRKLTTPHYVDMGQGLLQVIEEIHLHRRPTEQEVVSPPKIRVVPEP